MNLKKVIPPEEHPEPFTDSAIVDGLAEHGIQSAEAVCNPTNFSKIKLVTGGDTETALRFKRRVVQATAPAPSRTTKRRRPATVRPISTGVAKLDELMDGGLHARTVTSLIGRSSVCKTQICLQACLTAAASGGTAVFIDTTNSFAVTRIEQLCADRMNSSPEMKRTFEELLGRVCVIKAFDIFELFTALQQASTQFPSEEGSKLLVIDSIAAVAGPVMGLPEGSGMVALVHNTIRRLIRAHPELAVLVTNVVVQAEDSLAGITVDDWDTGGLSQFKPSLGLSWSAGVDLEIFMSSTEVSAAADIDGSANFNARRIAPGHPPAEEAVLFVSDRGVFSRAPSNGASQV